MARQFVVLGKSGDGWKELGTADAPTAELAVEQLAGKEGEYRAVPAAVWRPLRLQTVTRLAVVPDTASV